MSVSELLLYNIGYTYESFMKQTKGSLKNLFYGENVSFLDEERFPFIKGRGEGRILTADGSPINVYLYKENTTDKNGQEIWAMSVQVNWEYENLTLINGAICSGHWYFDCDEMAKSLM